MPSPIQDNLRQASFRGIQFQVDSSSFETGRRTQVHEYPQRDKPYAQDMGRSARNVEFDAFVIGADYLDKANVLIGAMEAGGSGALVHPWFGTLTVNAISCRVSFDRALGVAKFGLTFVEAGELQFPTAAQSTATLSRGAAVSMEIAAANRFAAVFAVAKKLDSVINQAIAVYGKVLYVLSAPAFALSGMLGFGSLPGNITSITALMGAPLSLAWNVAGLLNQSAKAKSGQLTASDSTTAPLVRGLVRMATDATLAEPAAQALVIGSSAWQIDQNTRAILALTRQLLLLQAVGLSSYLQCSVYDDAKAVRDELVAAIDAETLWVADDDLYQALIAARSAVFNDLTERSRNSARLTTLTPADVVPMLVLAYDYYEDAGRDLEMVARNKISHPGFVPVAPVWVLSA